VAEHDQPRLTIVAEPNLHPVFEALYPVKSPDEAVDEPDTLWVQTSAPLQSGLRAATVGLAGQAMLEYVPGDSWDTNKARLKAQLEAMRSWSVSREGSAYLFNGTSHASRESLRSSLAERVSAHGIVTVYLSHAARREEAEYWQEAFNAELVQVPTGHPWMEIVWQA
jgi:hypothetical protein